MPAERTSLRNIKRVALAAPILFAAAHFGCNTTGQKQPLVAPSQTSGQQDNPIYTPKTEQATPSSTEPTANQASRNLVFTEGGKTYELLPHVTLEQLSKTASDLSITVPEVADVKTFIDAAKQLAADNPSDPQIAYRLRYATNVFFAHSKICDNPQTDSSVITKKFAQELASYLKEYLEPQWETEKSRFLGSSCYWVEPQQNALVMGQPTISISENQPININRFSISKSSNESTFLVTETTPQQILKYELINIDGFDKSFLTNGYFKILVKKRISESTYLKMEALLDKVVYDPDPDDPDGIKLVNSAAKLLSDECDPANPKQYTNFFMKQLASYVFSKDREVFAQNEKSYFERCYWGEKYEINN